MKKPLALLLAAVMVLSLAACGEQPAATTAAPTTAATEAATTAAPTTEAATTAAPTTEAATTAAPTTEAATTAAPTTEAAPDALGKIVVLNNAVADLEGLNEEPTTRYNAIWLNGYSIAQFAEDNFVQMPADEDKVSIVSWQDGYANEDYTWGQLKNDYICLDAPAAGDLSTNNPEGFIFGLDVDKNAMPWHIGWIKVGHEAIVFMNEDGYNLQYLFEDLGMVAADSYQCIASDDYTEERYNDDLDAEIFVDDNGLIDLPSYNPEWKDYPLLGIRYLQVYDYAADFEATEEGIYHVTIAPNAKGVMTDKEHTRIEAPETNVLGGSVQTGYKVSDILAKYEIPAVEKVSYIDYTDATKVNEEAFDSFSAKYLVTEDTKDRGAYVTGPNTPYGTTYKNTGIFALDNNALVYVAKTFVQEAGFPVADVIAAMGITEFEEIEVFCTDGYSEVINAGDIADVFVFWNGETVDATSIAFPDYTLGNVEYINVIGK